MEENELQQVLDNILEDKTTNLKPENLKVGVTCLGIEGTLEVSNSNIKLFETIEDMNNDNEKVENTLAIVNKYNTKNLTKTDSFDHCILSKTIVLNEPITKYGNIMLSGNGGASAYIDVNPNGCQLGFSDNGASMNYSYTSSDGITYTLDDYDTDLLIILSSKIWYIPDEQGMNMWSDDVGHFITLESDLFEGAFKCQKVIDLCAISIPDMSKLSYDNYKPVFVKKDTPITVDDLLPLIDKLNLDSQEYDIVFDGTYYYVMGYTKTTVYYVCILYDANSKPSIIMYNVEDESDSITNNTIYKVPEDLSTIETIDRLSLPDSIKSNYGTVTSFSNVGSEFCVKYRPYRDNKLTNIWTYYINESGKEVFIPGYELGAFNTAYKLVYNNAPNQLTVNKNDVLPGIVAYGNNGVVTGDSSIFSNMPDIQNKNSEIYTHTKPYTKLQNIPENFFYSTATSYKNYIYLFCGGWNTSDKVYRYNVSLDSYEEWDDFSALGRNPAHGGISVTVGDYIYIFGGTSLLSDGLKYNPETKEKIDIANGHSYSNLHPTPVVIDDKIYIYDGKIKCFDTITSTWSDIWTDSIQGESSSNYLGTDGTDLYVIRSEYNGSPNYDYTTTMTKYILSTGETLEMTSPPYQANYGGIVSKNNKIYLFGSNNYENERNCYCYDISKNSWSKLYDLPYGYYDGGYGVINNQLYLFGGDTDLGNQQGGPDSRLAYSYDLDNISNLSVPDQQELILTNINNNLKPENLKSGITCLGVTGILETGTDNELVDTGIATVKALLSKPLSKKIETFDITSNGSDVGITNICYFGGTIELVDNTKRNAYNLNTMGIFMFLGIKDKKFDATITYTFKDIDNSTLFTISDITKVAPITQPENKMTQSLVVLSTSNRYEGTQEDLEILRQKLLQIQDVEMNINITNIDNLGIDTSDATAEASDIKEGKTAYVNGDKITGSFAPDENLDITSTVLQQSDITIGDDGFGSQSLTFKGAQSGYYTPKYIKNVTPTVSAEQSIVANAIGLTADKIKKGETILGITGTYEGIVSQEEYEQAVDTTEQILGINNTQ